MGGASFRVTVCMCIYLIRKAFSISCSVQVGHVTVLYIAQLNTFMNCVIAHPNELTIHFLQSSNYSTMNLFRRFMNDEILTALGTLQSMVLRFLYIGLGI